VATSHVSTGAGIRAGGTTVGRYCGWTGPAGNVYQCNGPVNDHHGRDGERCDQAVGPVGGPTTLPPVGDVATLPARSDIEYRTGDTCWAVTNLVPDVTAYRGDACPHLRAGQWLPRLTVRCGVPGVPTPPSTSRQLKAVPTWCTSSVLT